MLKILNENRHHSLPQKIFELGIITDENFKNKRHLAYLKIDAKASFTESKSITDAIMRETGLDFQIKDKNHPGFIKGRCASIIIKNKEIGLFGELHPKTINNFNLEYPIIALEIDLENLKNK